MSAFDELTLGEVERLTTECLNGAKFEDADPLQLAGAVMYYTQKRNDPTIEWQAFKDQTTMAAIKSFSEVMNADERMDPTNGVNALTS